jgi:hypothetical protein
LEEEAMKKTSLILAVIGGVSILLAACAPGSSDPAAPYYPTYTAIAQGLIDLANTATAQAAQPAQPAAVSADTPTPPPPVGGTENVQQGDGTTKYSDYDAGFEMVLPSGWIGLRPGAQEFNDALKSEGAANEDLKAQMTADQQGYEPVKDRYYMYATKPEEFENTLLSYGKVAWNAGDATVIDQNKLGELVQSLEMSPDMPGVRVVASNIAPNENGVPVMVIGANYTIEASDGTMVPLYLNFIYFKPTDNSTVRVILSSWKDYRDVTGPDVDSIVQSIKLVGQ